MNKQTGTNKASTDKGTAEYMKHLRDNSSEALEYYKKSLTKTEQQKFLESSILGKEKFDKIADIGCGGGTLTFHLSKIYPESDFYLVDLNPEAIQLAKDINPGNRFHFYEENLYTLDSISDNFFDAVFCWQVLSCMDNPMGVFESLLRIAKPGGKIYICGLFNLNQDVDLYIKAADHTRPNAMDMVSYNVVSKFSAEKWVNGRATMKFSEFNPAIDFVYNGKGLGTYTVETSEKRIQISAGILMSWVVLEMEKK